MLSATRSQLISRGDARAMIMFDIPAYFLSFSLISAIACQAEIVQDRSSSAIVRQ